MNFENLEFEPSRFGGGIATRVFFPNGYGASIIRNDFSYGGEHGFYELAVLKGRHNDCDICYDTPITSDAEGYLSPGAVTELLKKIEKLP